MPVHQPCVLLVEDEALIRINTADMLTDMGHDVIEAGTAAEALAATSEHEFDILVTDVGLPGLNGRQLADQARALETLAELGVRHKDVIGTRVAA